MRLSAFLLVAAAAGLVGGAWLIGMWCVGLALIVESLTLAGFAADRAVMTRKRRQLPPMAHTIDDIFERARRAS